jgi:hypothetical protein
MAIPLPPAQVFSSETPIKNQLGLTLFLDDNISARMRSCPLPREHVYRAVAQKRPWYIRQCRGRCIVTVLHAKILNYTVLTKYVTGVTICMMQSSSWKASSSSSSQQIPSLLRNQKVHMNKPQEVCSMSEVITLPKGVSAYYLET